MLGFKAISVTCLDSVARSADRSDGVFALIGTDAGLGCYLAELA